MASFMKKEELESKAKELGVSLEGMTFPQKQGAVMAAMKEAGVVGEAPVNVAKKKKGEQGLATDTSREPGPVTRQHQKPVLLEAQRIVPPPPTQQEILDSYRGKTLVEAPEMAPTVIQPFAIREDLGPEMEVEDDSLYKAAMGGRYSPVPDSEFGTTGDPNLATKTFKVKKKDTGRRVMGDAKLPKANVGITFRPAEDMFEVYSWQGKKGYKKKDVEAAVRQAGDEVWLKYEKYFDAGDRAANGKIFYLHNILCIDISYSHGIMKSIEDDAKKERALQKKLEG
jgi:hypothetical protein